MPSFSFFICHSFEQRRNNQVERFRPTFLVLLLCFLFFGMIQVFNPSSTSVFYGLMGMKLYFIYVPVYMSVISLSTQS